MKKLITMAAAVLFTLSLAAQEKPKRTLKHDDVRKAKLEKKAMQKEVQTSRAENEAAKLEEAPKTDDKK